MANPQKENGYTAIAHELLEAYARVDFRGCTRNMLDVILRKTYGYNKKRDRISFSQFESATGKGRRTVIYALQELESKKLIFVTKGVGEINQYEINKNFSTWEVQNSAPAVKANRNRAKLSSAKLRTGAKLRQEVVQNSDKKVKSFAPTKDNIQKIVTKESTASSMPTPAEQAKKFFQDRAEQLSIVDRLVKTGKYPSSLVLAEMPKFISYWTEPLRSGKKLKWESERAFEITRRLATWLGYAIERQNRRPGQFQQPQQPRRDYQPRSNEMSMAFEFCGKCDHGFINGHPCSNCVTNRFNQNAA